jgi:hypothetical protein
MSKRAKKDRGRFSAKRKADARPAIDAGVGTDEERAAAGDRARRGLGHGGASGLVAAGAPT